MATGEKAKAERAKKRAAATKLAEKNDAAFLAERRRNEATAEARALSAINEPAKVKPDPQGDIDQRMAALLKDHIEMGARPK